MSKEEKKPKEKDLQERVFDFINEGELSACTCNTVKEMYDCEKDCGL